MKSICRILLLIVAAAVATLFACASDSRPAMPDETLHYNVMFKWGLINKKAGRATLSLHRTDTAYISTLTARSEPWADRFFRVRDTLNGRMDLDRRPLFYEKIAHEGSDHKHDRVVYDYSQPGNVIGRCIRKVYKKGNLEVDETRTLEAENYAVDMLTSFYYMRNLPFESMAPGHTTVVPIFSGKQKETLTIRYVGEDDVDLNGSRLPAYHVKFIFTSRGGTKSSDDMDAWISTAPARVPLRMEGKLPVGKVRCLLAE